MVRKEVVKEVVFSERGSVKKKRWQRVLMKKKLMMLKLKIIFLTLESKFLSLFFFPIVRTNTHRSAWLPEVQVSLVLDLPVCPLREPV